MENIGMVVGRLREVRGMSKAELSRRSSVSESYLSRLEAGRYKSATNTMVMKLARGLGVPPQELMTRGHVEPRDIGDAVRNLLGALPPSVRVYATLAEAEKGGKIVSTLFVPRKATDDEASLFGVLCPRKCLPLVFGSHCSAVIDRRDSAPSDGSIVLWQDGDEVMGGVYHQLGDKRWVDNTQGQVSVNGHAVYKVQYLIQDVSGGLD